MIRLSFTAVLFLALVGCSRPGAVEQPTPEPLPGTEETPTVEEQLPELAAPGSNAVRPVARVVAGLSLAEGDAPSFRIEETPDITFVARVTDLRGDAHLALVLVSPDGNPYAARTWNLEGDGSPLDQAFTVPVAGTAIEERALRGEWKAELFLDGQPAGQLFLEVE
jgi:hypothetical protein